MAPSPFRSKFSRHARSSSVPSISHPLTLQVQEQLHRVRESEASSSSLALSSLSLSYNLSGLKDLYDCVNDFLHLPQTQQALAQERGEKWVDEVLDGSLRSLDVCGTAKDALSEMKERLTELQSSFRRTRGEFGLTNEAEAYIASRKKVTKNIRECLGDVRKVQKQHVLSSLLDKNYNIVAIVGVLREAELITLNMLESLLSFLSGPKVRSRPSRPWVSRVMNKKPGLCDGNEMERCEFQKVDVKLRALLGHKTHDSLGFWHAEAQKQLDRLELSISDLENGLECIFRSLIKTRVALLNILNQ